MTTNTNAQRHRVKYDGTINLGHLLTAVSMLIAGSLAYGNLDKRTEMNTAAIASASDRMEATETRLMAAIEKVSANQGDTNKSVAAIQLNVAVLRDRASAGDAYPGVKR